MTAAVHNSQSVRVLLTVREGRCYSPVVEVHGVRLADDTSNEGGEGEKSSGESKLHCAIEENGSAKEVREGGERTSRLVVVPSLEVRDI